MRDRRSYAHRSVLVNVEGDLRCCRTLHTIESYVMGTDDCC
jgi:hypothetical protein